MVIRYRDSNLDAVSPGKDDSESVRIVNYTIAVAKRYDFHRDGVF